MKSLNLKNNRGFSLVEIIISLAISSIFLLALTNFFISTNKITTAQEKIAEIQSDIRSAMELMSRDIRMAGFNSIGAAGNDAGFQSGGDDRNNTDSNSIGIKYYVTRKTSSGWQNVTIDTAYWYDSSTKTLKFRNGTGKPFVDLTEKGSISKAVFSYPSTDMVNIELCGKITGAYSNQFDGEYCFINSVKRRN
ncbi:MAG: hypothetical protein CSA18_02320 [Deltaproteobacteria bacterium]|nr:MAG: hypothetical protein CSB21_01145 [Deltaproteobacteria bacterium]PIE74966.1 MAG: hypothetical protein CSA18_02320 [Deltaproteobacteria bacterium]